MPDLLHRLFEAFELVASVQRRRVGDGRMRLIRDVVDTVGGCRYSIALSGALTGSAGHKVRCGRESRWVRW